jgi:hypothetical protein
MIGTETCHYTMLFRQLPANLHTISLATNVPPSLPTALTTGWVPLELKAKKATVFVHTSFYEMHGQAHFNPKYLWVYTSLPGPEKDHRILWKCSTESGGKRILQVNYADELKALDTFRINPVYLKHHLVALYEFARSIRRTSLVVAPNHARIILLSK